MAVPFRFSGITTSQQVTSSSCIDNIHDIMSNALSSLEIDAMNCYRKTDQEERPDTCHSQNPMLDNTKESYGRHCSGPVVLRN